MADGVLKVRVGGSWESVPTLGPIGPQGPTGPVGPTGPTGSPTTPHAALHYSGGSDQILGPLTLTATHPQLRVNATNPVIQLRRTGAAVDTGNWRMFGAGDDTFRIDCLNDAETAVLTSPLTMSRAGVVSLIGNVIIASTRPNLVLQHAATVAKARMMSVSGSGTDIWFTRNLSYDGANWLLDDTAFAGGLLGVDSGGQFNYYYVPAAANPAALLTRFAVSASGVTSITGGDLIINKTGPRVTFNDTSQAVDNKKFQIGCNANTLILQSLNDAESASSGSITMNRSGAVTTTGDFTIGGATITVNAPAAATIAQLVLIEPNALPAFQLINYQNSFQIYDNTSGTLLKLDHGGALQTRYVIYPGRIDTVAIQNSWYIASHATYGLFSNVGMYFGGAVKSFGYVYPGQVTVANNQDSWYLASHSSYGLYSNTGLYLASYVWPEGVESRTIVRAGTGLYDYARSTPVGVWIDWTPSAVSGITISSIETSRYMLVGKTCIYMWRFVAGIAASQNYVQWYMPVTAVKFHSNPCFLGNTVIDAQCYGGYNTFFTFLGASRDGTLPPGSWWFSGTAIIDFA